MAYKVVVHPLKDGDLVTSRILTEWVFEEELRAQAWVDDFNRAFQEITCKAILIVL